MMIWESVVFPNSIKRIWVLKASVDKKGNKQRITTHGKSSFMTGSNVYLTRKVWLNLCVIGSFHVGIIYLHDELKELDLCWIRLTPVIIIRMTQWLKSCVHFLNVWGNIFKMVQISKDTGIQHIIETLMVWASNNAEMDHIRPTRGHKSSEWWSCQKTRDKS